MEEGRGRWVRRKKKEEAERNSPSFATTIVIYAASINYLCNGTCT